MAYPGVNVFALVDRVTAAVSVFNAFGGVHCVFSVFASNVVDPSYYVWMKGVVDWCLLPIAVRTCLFLFFLFVVIVSFLRASALAVAACVSRICRFLRCLLGRVFHFRWCILRWTLRRGTFTCCDGVRSCRYHLMPGRGCLCSSCAAL